MPNVNEYIAKIWRLLDEAPTDRTGYPVMEPRNPNFCIRFLLNPSTDPTFQFSITHDELRGFVSSRRSEEFRRWVDSLIEAGDLTK